jgi:hypothetical protein
MIIFTAMRTSDLTRITQICGAFNVPGVSNPLLAFVNTVMKLLVE